MVERVACYPYQTSISAYGNGGFRFAGMSHRGSILCLPSGIHSWQPVAATNMILADFERVFADLSRHSVMLLGTGKTQIFPPPDIMEAFAKAQIGLEPMSTGAAARTYNVLLAEGRAISAALIAVS